MEDKKIIELEENKVFSQIKKHKWTSVAASFAVVSVIGASLAFALTSGESAQVKSASGGATLENVKPVDSLSESTTTTVELTPEPVVETPQATSPTTTKPKVKTPAPAIPARPSNPSNLRLDGVEIINESEESGTYNVNFSWNASPTANVAYCVDVEAEGVQLGQIGTCEWTYPYLVDGTNTGFGLVFKKNTNYKMTVTAIDPYNQKSDTVTLTWKLP